MLRKNIKNILKQYLNENYLNYDEMDLDFFSRRYLVGRFFKTENEAVNYLLSNIDKSDNKSIDDFIIVKEDSHYRIYPKPSEIDIKRNDASKFIQKNGILSSSDLRYITHPLYAYIRYKNIDKIKELGVKYKFKPINQINLDGVLSRFIKEYGHINSISDIDEESKILKFYNYDLFNVNDGNSMSIDDIRSIKSEVENLLNNFNNKLGTDYEIFKTTRTETDASLKKSLLNKLDDSKYNPSNEFNKKYKSVYFIIKRGKNEDEFLAEIEMEDINKPKMK